MALITVNNLTFQYDRQRPILQGLNASFGCGSCSLLMGPSGCGKSTLLRLIAGLLPKYGGKLVHGKVALAAIHGRQPRIGMLFQDPAMQFALDTPRREIEFALENEQVPPAEMPARVKEGLAFCHAADLADRKITTLSGGQQQRVALAVIIAMRPDILLLDEPFASIDEGSRQFLIQQLAVLSRQKGLTLIITDHDCHGYQSLHPQIWDFKENQVAKLSESASQERLASADRQAASPLKTAVPNSDLPAAFYLKDIQIKRGQTALVQQASLMFIKNKITLLTGANGVGKSTLFKALARLIPYQGTITYQGQDIQTASVRKYYQQVGLVFQDANDQFLNVTVGEELSLSAKHQGQPYFTAERLQQALSTLKLTGLDDRVVYSLSGGQRKKLQLLLMLMTGHSVLLLDEPFAGLDTDSRLAVQQLIKNCQAVRPQTIILISHQLTGLSRFIDYHLVLQGHQLIYQGGAGHES